MKKIIIIITTLITIASSIVYLNQTEETNHLENHLNLSEMQAKASLLLEVLKPLNNKIENNIHNIIEKLDNKEELKRNIDIHNWSINNGKYNQLSYYSYNHDLCLRKDILKENNITCDIHTADDRVKFNFEIK